MAVDRQPGHEGAARINRINSFAAQLRIHPDPVLIENSQAESRVVEALLAAALPVREEFGISAGTVLSSSL